MPPREPQGSYGTNKTNTSRTIHRNTLANQITSNFSQGSSETILPRSPQSAHIFRKQLRLLEQRVIEYWEELDEEEDDDNCIDKMISFKGGVDEVIEEGKKVGGISKKVAKLLTEIAGKEDNLEKLKYKKAMASYQSHKSNKTTKDVLPMVTKPIPQQPLRNSVGIADTSIQVDTVLSVRRSKSTFKYYDSCITNWLDWLKMEQDKDGRFNNENIQYPSNIRIIFQYMLARRKDYRRTFRTVVGFGYHQLYALLAHIEGMKEQEDELGFG